MDHTVWFKKNHGDLMSKKETLEIKIFLLSIIQIHDLLQGRHGHNYLVNYRKFIIEGGRNCGSVTVLCTDFYSIFGQTVPNRSPIKILQTALQFSSLIEENCSESKFSKYFTTFDGKINI